MLDNIAHGGIETARGVHLDDEGLGTIVFGFFDAAFYVIYQDRIDRTFYGNDINMGTLCPNTGPYR